MSWDWQYSGDILPDLLRGLRYTVIATLAGYVIAIVLGLVWTLLRRTPSRVFNQVIRWVTEFGPVPPVQIDRTLMEQALVNVIKNAIEAVDHDGRVTLRTGVTADRPWLQVEDTGPGLAPEVRAHLFTPFFSTKESGQGIGLTLVQEILTRHGFAFTLDGPDGGPTKFTIWFS